MEFSSFARLAVGTVVAAWLLLSPSGLVAQPQKFKAAIAVVPLDVRVVDGKGNPVTDLTRADFVVKEDGVQQEITHFERQVLTPGSRSAAPEVLIPGTAGAAAIKLQNRRVFFIALGRQWLPSNVFGMSAAIAKFLRERVLPQDYAVVSAFGRITDLTTDHEALAQVVERLDVLQRSVDSGRDRIDRFRAMYRAAAHVSRPEDSDITRALDAVFAPASSGTHLAPQASRAEFEAVVASILSHAATSVGISHPPKTNWTPGGNTGAGDWERQLQIPGLTGHALTMLNAVQYLRFIDGEKHLVYFPPGKVAVAALEDDRDIARIASDARVAIHIIRANGLSARSAPLDIEFRPSMESRHIAELTGGQTFIDRWPDQALAKIEAVTRVGYLLAYAPAKSEADGRHRKISISVTRPRGATVIARQSYLATDKPATYDERQFAVQDRIMTIGETPGNVADLGIKLQAKPQGKTVDADVQVDLSMVKVTADDDHHNAKLELVVFCSDAQQRLVGQRWMTLDVKLKDVDFARALSEGFHLVASVPVSGTVRFVKAVVYDYATDRAGSAVVRLR